MAKTEDKEVKEKVVYRLTSSVGSIETYDLAKNFDEWLERFELFIDINNLTNSRRSAFFSLIGEKGYHVIRSLCTPRKPKEIVYEELVKKFSKYCNPKPSAVAERSKFRARIQKEGESLHEFIADTKKWFIFF